MRKVRNLVTACCLALLLLAVTAGGVSAATAASVWVNGIELSEGDYLVNNSATVVTSGATTEPASYVCWYYAGTLTLNNAEITKNTPVTIGDTDGTCGIYAAGNLNIVLQGDNDVEGAPTVYSAGIAVNGNISITSSETGGLTVTGGKAGIYSNGGDITIDGNAVVSATSTGWLNDSIGFGAVFAMNGDVIFRDCATINGDFGKNAPYSDHVGIVCAYNGNVEITGHVDFSVDAHGGAESCFGIYAGPTASITSGNVTITNGARVVFDKLCLGVGAVGNLTIGKNAGLVILNAMYGIVGAQKITVAGGALEIYNLYGNPFLGNLPLTLIGSYLAAAAYTDINYHLTEAADLSKVGYGIGAGQYVYDNVHDNYIRYLYYRPIHHCESYSDCQSWDWAQPYDCFVIENNIMGSVNKDSNYFDSTGAVTRGMVVTVMYRLAGSPALSDADYAKYNGKFSDVKKDDWYYDAVVWAYCNGVTEGMSDTSFAPQQKTSREQIVTFFWRFSDFLGYDNSGSADLGSYQDLGQVGAFAVAAFQWSVSNNIVNGTTLTTLSPKDSCTRGQMAKIITCFGRTFMDDRDWIDIGDF